MENLKEPTGCVCCGTETSGFTVCVYCGVECFKEELTPMEYVKKHNPERFKMIIEWYDSIPAQI